MKIDEILRNKFEDKIIERGEYYFYNCNVLDVVRNYETNDYVGIVKGNYNNEYTVTINNLESDELAMHCNCPYTGNCKHIYSVLLSIEDKRYQTTKLLPVIESKNCKLEDIIKKIPSKEIKDYFISKFSNMDEAMEINFKEKFLKYYPLNDYEYYYNNLYNRVIISRKFINLLDDYSELMKKYLDDLNYNQVLIIFKAIIDIFVKFDLFFKDRKVVTYLNEISIYSRIAYRQADIKIKKSVDSYTKELLEIENLNVYIEDMIINNFIQHQK